MGRALTAAWLLLAIGGCEKSGAGGDCPLGCIGKVFATLDLSCAPNDLTTVAASGPCAEPDVGLDYWIGVNDHRTVFVASRSPGTCHIVQTFASGFTFSTDVTFASQAQGCGCSEYTAPTGSQPIKVDNPGSTCAGDASAEE